MSDDPSIHEEKIRSFWHRYVESLHQSGIKPPFDRWFVLRAEQYIQACRDRKLADQTPADVDAYLTEAGRRGGLKDWQFRQIVDAIQKLFELAGVSWLAQVDWDHWRASARALGSSHPTVARDYGADSAGPLDEVPGVACKSVRQAHGALLERVRAAVRLRGYAIKTEQSYLHWIMRFIGYLGNADPSEKGAQEVAHFLEYLALERKVSASTQNLALNALVLLYRETLGRSELDMGAFVRARRPRCLPSVPTPGEVALLLGKLSGTQRLMAALMYGSGMRLMECSRLRVPRHRAFHARRTEHLPGEELQIEGGVVDDHQAVANGVGGVPPLPYRHLTACSDGAGPLEVTPSGQGGIERAPPDEPVVPPRLTDRGCRSRASCLPVPFPLSMPAPALWAKQRALGNPCSPAGREGGVFRSSAAVRASASSTNAQRVKA